MTYPFEVRPSPMHGLGAFATEPIPAGTRVIEYAGARISPAEAHARYPDSTPGATHHTELFAIDDDIVIDASVDGNEARFINHSCDPNAEAIIEDDRIFIYAKKNIQPGTEILYDYQYERYPEHTEEDERFYACLCGSAKCRGTILKAPKKRGKQRKSR